jgi:hypothetical protein
MFISDLARLCFSLWFQVPFFRMLDTECCNLSLNKEAESDVQRWAFTGLARSFMGTQIPASTAETTEIISVPGTLD